MTVFRFTVTLIQTSWTISVSRTGWWIFVTSVVVCINSRCVDLCLIDGIDGYLCSYREMAVEGMCKQRNIQTFAFLVADWLHWSNYNHRWDKIERPQCAWKLRNLCWAIWSFKVVRECCANGKSFWFCSPLMWLHDLQSNVEGGNSVVLLKRTLKAKLSVREATVTVSITILSFKFAARNW